MLYARERESSFFPEIACGNKLKSGFIGEVSPDEA
jgi:hypothetical protein